MNEASTFSTWEQAVQWLREQPDRQQLVLDAYYDDPLTTAAARYLDSEEWHCVAQLLPVHRPLTALDVGAGRGIASFALAKEGLDVTALEPDGSSLVGAESIRRLARDSGLSIKVRQDFSERLPFSDSSFDVVFARAVLHHTNDLGAACREFYRVLKPGGIFVAIREHVISKPEDINTFFEAHPLHRLYGGENAFLLGHYTHAIQSAGFHLEQVLAPLRSPINYAPYSLCSLQSEAAQRVGAGIPFITAIAKRVFSMPGVWGALLPLMELMDNRPGRLYSFVGRRL